MSTSYPGGVDSFTPLTPGPGGSRQNETIGGRSHADMMNDIMEGIVALQTTLGLDPQGLFSTVKERILATAAGNLLDQVADVSFTQDDDTDDIPNGWTVYSNDDYTASLSGGKLHVDADAVFAIISPLMPVAEDLYYNLSAYLQSVAGNLVLKIEWYDADEDLVDYNYQQWTGTSVRTRRLISIVAPATTAFAKITLESNGGGEAYFELPSFRLQGLPDLTSQVDATADQVVVLGANGDALFARQNESEVKQTFAYAVKFTRG